MRSSILAIFALLLASPAYSATITSAASGNWSNTATWTGGVVPGNGDTAVVAAAHTVTIDQAVAVGTSPVTGAVLTIHGNLVLASSITVRGDVVSDAGKTVTLQAGTTWQFDSSLAAGTPIYKFTCSGKIISNGTADNRVTMTSAEGSGNWYFLRGGIASEVDLNYTDFKHASGSLNSGGLELYVGSGCTSKIDHCAFIGCQRVFCFDVKASGSLIITNNTWSSTSAAGFSGDLTILNGSMPTTGVRTLTGNTFDMPVALSMPDGIVGWTIESNYFTSSAAKVTAGLITYPGLSTTAVGNPLSLKNNIFAGDNPNELVTIWSCGVFEDNYMIQSAATNPHFLHFSPPAKIAGSCEALGNIFEYTGTSDEGDGFLLLANTSGGLVTLSFHNNIVLPSAGSGSSCGSLFSYMQNAGTTVVLNAYHNTYMSGVQGATFKEGNWVRSNLGIFKSNLQWDTSARGYKLRSAEGIYVYSGTASSLSSDNVTLNKTSAGWVADYFVNAGRYILKITGGTNSGESRVIASNTATQITVASDFTAPCDATSQFQVIVVDPMDADYNCGWNYLQGTVYDADGQNPVDGNGYKDMAATTAPGAHDVNVDPQFVDAARNVGKWGQALHGTDGTTAAGLAVLRSSPTLTSELVAYVKAGFVPQNAALFTAAHDGGTIGAVEASAEPEPTATLTASVTSGTAPLTVTFTGGFSDYTPDGYSMNYGDTQGEGGPLPNNPQSFTHTYTTAGTYQARYHVSTTSPVTGIYSEYVMITVDPTPVTRTIFEGKIIFEGNFTAE